VLSRIEIPSFVDQTPVPQSIERLIGEARARIETFQDRWDQPQMEQFVAADYRHVYQSIHWTLQTQLLIGRRFLEWGCGFAVVSALAATFDLEVIGIEAEGDLLRQGRHTIATWDAAVELVHGNFLPDRAESLAADPTLPSIGHVVASAYEAIGLDLDDFALVYSYPWPGEDNFHEAVFDRYGARGALLMMFCGPNDIRMCRKIR